MDCSNCANQLIPVICTHIQFNDRISRKKIQITLDVRTCVVINKNERHIFSGKAITTSTAGIQLSFPVTRLIIYFHETYKNRRPRV